MSAFDYSLFDADDLMQERSTLYCLPMIGVGTAYQEGLLSYLQRLAGAHYVSVRNLLEHIVKPNVNMHLVTMGSGFEKKYSKTVNGYSKYAQEIYKGLSTTTRRESLEFGTFLPWRNLFDGKGSGLLHATQRWCSSCLVEGREGTDGIVSYMLIWAVDVITHCPVHLSPLKSTCPVCGSLQPFIHASLAYGRCAACGCLLGHRDGLFDAEPISSKQLFLLKAVSQMISYQGNHQTIASPDVFSAQVRAVAGARCDDSIAELERQVGFRKSSMSKWILLRSRPQFDQFLELCSRLDILPIDLLDGSWASGASRGFKPEAFRQKRVPVKLTVMQESALLSEIEALILDDSRYINGTDLCRKHGITTAHFIYWYPSHYAKFMKHRSYVRSKLWDERKERVRNAAREVVRKLYASHVRLTRHSIQVALDKEGLCVKDPIIRNAAFEERAKLDGTLGEEN